MMDQFGQSDFLLFIYCHSPLVIYTNLSDPLPVHNKACDRLLSKRELTKEMKSEQIE